MRRMSKLLCVVSISLGMAVVGCDSQGQQEAESEQAEEAEADQPEKQAEQAQQEQETEESEADYSEKDYVQASYELSCVDTELSGEEVDLEQVEQDILGKYGFDQETYEQADEEFEDNDKMAERIDQMLEDCTTDTARDFAGLSDEAESDSEQAKQADQKPAPKPKPATVGKITSKLKDSAGFDAAGLSISVKENFSASGTFKGKREGKGFQIPVEGKVSKDNKLSLSGSSGKNEVSIGGTLTKSGSNAEVSGSIWEKKFSTTMKLN